jgi:hypothetical protein
MAVVPLYSDVSGVDGRDLAMIRLIAIKTNELADL